MQLAVPKISLQLQHLLVLHHSLRLRPQPRGRPQQSIGLKVRRGRSGNEEKIRGGFSREIILKIKDVRPKTPVKEGMGANIQNWCSKNLHFFFQICIIKKIYHSPALNALKFHFFLLHWDVDWPKNGKNVFLLKLLQKNVRGANVGTMLFQFQVQALLGPPAPLPVPITAIPPARCNITVTDAL